MLNETSYKGRGSAFTDKDAFEAEIRTNCPSTVRWVEKKETLWLVPPTPISALALKFRKGNTRLIENKFFIY
jgi:hypothetical protein